MCPSYRATLRGGAFDARTRQRAAAGASADSWARPGSARRGVYDVLDLCLECRACKTECPTGVDVARFKSEFLADYWRRHGVPLRARVFGNVHRAARWGSRLAPLSNALTGSGVGRWMAEDGARDRPAPHAANLARDTSLCATSCAASSVSAGRRPIGDPVRDTFTSTPSRRLASPRSRCSRPRRRGAHRCRTSAVAARSSRRACSDDARALAAANIDHLS